MGEKCDHKGHYRIVSGVYLVIRFCTQCGKSWRLPTQGDYTGDHGGSFPVPEWEPIKEALEVEQTVKWDYDESEGI